MLTRKFASCNFRSYAECCLDDVTASHAVANDMIVHFGHSCFSTEGNSIEGVNTEGNCSKHVVYIIDQDDSKTIDASQLAGLGSVYLYADISYQLQAEAINLDHVHVGLLNTSYRTIPQFKQS